MSKNVKVNGVDYTGVSQVQLPTTAGGTALFKDADEITTPSGSVTITENGTHNVSAYAQAVVNVASGGESADNYEEFIKVLLGGYERPMPTEDVYFTVPAGLTRLRDGAFANIVYDNVAGKIYVTLPDTVEHFDSGTFSYNAKIVIGRLPANLKSIGGTCFDYACLVFGSTTELEIPASMETIGSLAFYRYNGGVNTVTFKGTPTSIAPNAFQDCSIKTVNVPWAEGAVANAPWGAETVNYNYTGA
jgi:hypothetical protein